MEGAKLNSAMILNNPCGCMPVRYASIDTGVKEAARYGIDLSKAMIQMPKTGICALKSEIRLLLRLDVVKQAQKNAIGYSIFKPCGAASKPAKSGKER